MRKRKLALVLTVPILISSMGVMRVAAQLPGATPVPEEPSQEVQAPEPMFANNGMITNPTRSISLAPMNHRYFYYTDGITSQTIALIGVSGEFLPHVSWVKPPALYDANNLKAIENCGLHLMTASANSQKYKTCLSQLSAAGLNKIRVWVGLNQSPGTPFDSTVLDPFPHEQPYTWNAAQKKWDLETFDDQYFKNLYTVVNTARSQGVIVEVTLFDPFDGKWMQGPWAAARHTQTSPCGATEFTNNLNFVRGDKAASYQFSDPGQPIPPIDTNCRNLVMRNYQVALMKKVVRVLNGTGITLTPGGPIDPAYSKPLYNVFWELANEPDGTASSQQQIINWHYFMAQQLRDYEKSVFPNSFHLIAVNYELKPVIDNLVSSSSSSKARNYIDIVEGHYVKKDPLTSSLAEKGDETYGLAGDEAFEPDTSTATTVAAFGAVAMIREYTPETTVGPNALASDRVWGFNETRITGLNPDDPHVINAATSASARAEAWEFMLNGGGVYDHLGFRWGNNPGGIPNPGPNPGPSYDLRVAIDTRKDLGVLSSVINQPYLATMRRDSSWIANLPPYPSPSNALTKFFAAMRSDDTFLYYAHHSTYSNNPDGAKYNPIIRTSGTLYKEQILFKNPFSCRARFSYEWITPNSGHSDIYLPNETLVYDPFLDQVAVPSLSTSLPTVDIDGNGMMLLPNSSPYAFDLALRVKKVMCL